MSIPDPLVDFRLAHADPAATVLAHVNSQNNDVLKIAPRQWWGGRRERGAPAGSPLGRESPGTRLGKNAKE
ncbi:MAG: hypothetical protein K0U80_12080 [Actinomycetia bacterium]|nr:hypothetical protein [Actinomycetes bacterium]MCH9759819.1 hypothetical protein [Actinomycetes bacterium]